MGVNAVSQQMRSKLEHLLAGVESDESTKIILAVESGSRAWGFHSPDSDYDVRFIYARPVEWHLQLKPGRDVIELPIDEVLDISGWDLRKSLLLALKGNAVIAEWLQSPIVYRTTPIADRLHDFARRALRRRPVTWHYLSMLGPHADRAFTPDGVRVKRLFYALRPALTLRWMRLHDAGFAPMDMTQLRKGCALRADQSDAISDLIAAKTDLPESGMIANCPAPVRDLIKEEQQKAHDWLGSTTEPRVDPALFAEAERLHQDVVSSLKI